MATKIITIPIKKTKTLNDQLAHHNSLDDLLIKREGFVAGKPEASISGLAATRIYESASKDTQVSQIFVPESNRQGTPLYGYTFVVTSTIDGRAEGIASDIANLFIDRFEARYDSENTSL